MRIVKILFVVLLVSIISCKEKIEKEIQVEEPKTEFEFGVWITANKDRATEDYAKELEEAMLVGMNQAMPGMLVKVGTSIGTQWQP